MFCLQAGAESGEEGWGGGGGQTMYTQVSKCKNDKIFFKKQKN
jgi:hypothetical protein